VADTFEDLQADFLRLTAEIVWCSVTTVAADNRPRSRILHPIWELVDGRPVGWITTRRTPLKAAHLRHSPCVTCAYWRPSHDAVLVDCLATWQDSPEQKQRVWSLFTTTPPPLGYDPGTIWPGGPTDPDYSVLKLEPERIQIVTVETLTTRVPRIWQAHRPAGDRVGVSAATA
jgi:general stress protein 26